MPLSADLLRRFNQVRTLSEGNSDREVWLVQDSSLAFYVVKLFVIERLDPEYRAELEQYASQRNEIIFPLESGRAEDGRFYEISRYEEARNLEELRLSNLPLDLTACRNFLSRILEILQGLHHECGDSGYIHGDIKPTNILQNEEGNFFLLDFDSAQKLDPISNSCPYPRHYTPAYAAPEVFAGGAVNSAADYWSLGMLILEWVMSSHPLTDLSDDEIRTHLGTDWRPNFSVIENTQIRALLGGLLTRSPTLRWQYDECLSWVNEDIEIISQGLARSGEHNAATPFDVNGSQVYNIRELAGAILRDWDTDTLASNSLLEWLVEGLNRRDVAQFLRRLLSDESLNPDLRLLQFTHELHNDFPAIWRSITLDEENIDAVAQSAIENDETALDWLNSLLDGRVFNFFSIHGNDSAGNLGQRFLDAWHDYQQSWEYLIENGAPEDARPDNGTALPIVVRSVFSPDQSRELSNVTERLLEPALLLRRAHWYLLFGSRAEEISNPRKLILQQLGDRSLLDQVNLRNIDDLREINEERLRNSVIFLDSQAQLLSKLTVRPQSSVIVLNPDDTFFSNGDGTGEIVQHIPRNIFQRISAYFNSQRNMQNAEGNDEETSAEDSQQQTEEQNTDEDIIESQTPHFDVRAIPLSPVDMDSDFQADMYLALLSWHFMDGIRIRLCLDGLDSDSNIKTRLPVALTPFHNFYDRRMTPGWLPSQGHLLLVITSSLQIRLQYWRNWYDFKETLSPIEFRMEREMRLRQTSGNIISHEKKLVLPDQLESEKSTFIRNDNDFDQSLSVKKSLLKPQVVKGEHRINKMNFCRNPTNNERYVFKTLSELLRRGAINGREQ